MPEVRTKRPCPVCDGHTAEQLYQQRFASLDEGALLDGYDVVACAKCGTVFAEGIPEQAAFDRYYADMSKYEYGEREGRESEYDLQRFAAMADACTPHLDMSSARILDIGCATGGLLAAFRERGAAVVHGVDPSAACARAAKKLYDIPVSVGALGSLPSLPTPFDLVALVGVVEHLREVKPALRAVRDLLVPGGTVFVEIPDAEGFADWPGPPFQEFSVEHLNFLSAKSLTNLMATCGFEPVFCSRTAREWAPGSIAPVVFGLFRKVGAPLPVTFDASGAEGVRKYVARCLTDEGAVAARLRSQMGAGERILVWGAGTHTQRLIAAGILDSSSVVLIADGNVHYHGRTIRGIPVMGPEALAERPDPVLISSRTYQREMVSRLRDVLKLPNRLITLYDI